MSAPNAIDGKIYFSKKNGKPKRLHFVNDPSHIEYIWWNNKHITQNKLYRQIAVLTG
jgi:hypothetical protein